jgi:hypothetical protein
MAEVGSDPQITMPGQGQERQDDGQDKSGKPRNGTITGPRVESRLPAQHLDIEATA